MVAFGQESASQELQGQQGEPHKPDGKSLLANANVVTSYESFDKIIGLHNDLQCISSQEKLQLNFQNNNAKKSKRVKMRKFQNDNGSKVSTCKQRPFHQVTVRKKFLKATKWRKKIFTKSGEKKEDNQDLSSSSSSSKSSLARNDSKKREFISISKIYLNRKSCSGNSSSTNGGSQRSRSSNCSGQSEDDTQAGEVTQGRSEAELSQVFSDLELGPGTGSDSGSGSGCHSNQGQCSSSRSGEDKQGQRSTSSEVEEAGSNPDIDSDSEHIEL